MMRIIFFVCFGIAVFIAAAILGATAMNKKPDGETIALPENTAAPAATIPQEETSETCEDQENDPEQEAFGLTAEMQSEIAASEVLSKKRWGKLDDSLKSQVIEYAKDRFETADLSPTAEQLETFAMLASDNKGWSRPLQMLLGELPADQPRLSVKDAEQIIYSALRQEDFSKWNFYRYVLDEFNKIAGCPDFVTGGPTYFYAIDSAMTKFVVVSVYEIAYVEVDATHEIITDCSLFYNIRPDIQSDEEALFFLTKECAAWLF